MIFADSSSSSSSSFENTNLTSRSSNELEILHVSRFPSDLVHYNAGRKLHTYIIVQELMNLQLCICVEIGFLLRRISSLTLSVLS